MGNKWQGQVRLNNHPLISKCFVSRTDAKRWSVATENKLRREDGGIAHRILLRGVGALPPLPISNRRYKSFQGSAH